MVSFKKFELPGGATVAIDCNKVTSIISRGDTSIIICGGTRHEVIGDIDSVIDACLRECLS